jgi:hypothetical protein
MKVSLWLFALSLAVVCFACWAMSHLLVQFWQHRPAGLPLPAFTQLILVPHSWLLFCPIPWVLYAAWLTFRKPITPDAAFVFAGTLCLAIIVVVSSVTVAALLPSMDLIIIF